MKERRREVLKRTGIFLLSAALVFLWTGASSAETAEHRSRQLNLIRYFPEDPLFAGATKVKDMGETLNGIEGLIQGLGGEETFKKYTDGLQKFNSDLGVDVKAELSNITGEAGLFLDLQNVDALIAAAGQNRKEAPQAFLKNVCLFVGLRDPDRFDAFVEKLAGRAQFKRETVSGPVFSYFRIPLEGKDWSLPLLYTHHKGTVLIAFSEETLASALETSKSGRNLSTSADYVKTFKHLTPNPDSWGYLNLPKLIRLLDSSAVIKGIISIKPEAQRVYTYVMGLEKEMGGVGWTIVRVEGGVLKQGFGPDLFSSPAAVAASIGVMSAIAGSRPAEASAVRAKQAKTMADIRTIGTAVETFHVDRGIYPGPTEGFVPVEQIRELLEPDYVKKLPLQDAWGSDILYRSDGKSYAILSPGKDGKLDVPYGPEIEKAETQKPGDDLVYSDRKFIRAPAESEP